MITKNFFVDFADINFVFVDCFFGTLRVITHTAKYFE